MYRGSHALEPRRRRAGSLIVMSAVVLGAGGAAHADSTPMLGSWNQAIKDEETWDNDHAEDTVDALLETCQSFFMSPISRTDEWLDFQELVLAAEGRGVRLFAVLPSPNTYYDDMQWFDTDGDGTLGDTPPDNTCSGHGEARWICDGEFMAHWLNAWEAAATAVSQLSSDHPGTIAGVVINDCMVAMESADDPNCLRATKLRKDQFQRVYDACHSVDPDCGFYPCITVSDVPRFLCPSWILGANYGVRMHNDEWMAVQLDVPLLPDPYLVRLSFLHEFGSTDDEIRRSVFVNGAQVMAFPAASDPRPTVAFASVDFDLDPGSNLVELKLWAGPTQDDTGDSCGVEFDEVTSGCGGEGDWWRIWDVRLEYWVMSGGEPVHVDVPLFPRFETNTDPTTYTLSGSTANPCKGAWFDWYLDMGECISNDQCRCPLDCTLPDDSVNGRMARRLVCAPSDMFLVHEVVDGFVPYAGLTTLHGPADALDPDLPAFRRLVQALERDAADHDVIFINWSLWPAQPLDPDVVVRRLEIAAEETDGAGVWQYPLGLHFMDAPDRRGIFAESPLLGTSADAQFMAQWPGRQFPIPGWYQRWVHIPPGGSPTDLRVELWDNRDASAGNEGLQIKSVAGGGMAMPYVSDPWADGTTAEYVPSGGSFATSTTSDPVIVEFANLASAPGVNTRLYWRAEDSAGNEIDPADWTFESGVSDPHPILVFESLQELYCNITASISACVADITGPTLDCPDGQVDALDFLRLVGQWGSPCEGVCTADITGPAQAPDGNVDALDYLLLISQWGSCF